MTTIAEIIVGSWAVSFFWDTVYIQISSTVCYGRPME